jgi:GT2 family glycosyltransferase/glycosyltransferase involved in cell wall biosynthesis
MFSSLPAYQAWRNRSAHSALDDPSLWSKYGKVPPFQPPTEKEWYELVLARADRPEAAKALVDVIIPVYDGYAETLRAVYNAVTAHNNTSHELVVISDCGPNQALNDHLEYLGSKGLFTFLKNDRNLGFIKTVNRGFLLHPDRDVLILNSDAFVTGDYLDRLRAHALGKDVATVTPFTSNGEICSYPSVCRDNSWQLELSDERLDQLASSVNRGRSVPIPTGVGFCMYITRGALRRVGLFDADAFGKGYGEENDFCVRATKLGYKHLLAGDVFVRHAGGVSFSERKLKAIQNAMRVMEQRHPGYQAAISAYIALDNAKILRRRLDVARLRAGATGLRAFLYVLHTWGGGTERHARDMAGWLREEDVDVFSLSPIVNRPERCELSLLTAQDRLFVPNLEFDLSEADELQQALQQLKVSHLHVQHIVGYHSDYFDLLPTLAGRLGAALDITVHDYFPFCPRIHLLNESGRYCGEPALASCNRCVKNNGAPTGLVEVGEWRRRFSDFLAKARFIFVPDQDVATRLARHFSGVDFIVRPHPESWIEPASTTKSKRSERRRVALIGALHELKGAGVLKALVKDAHSRGLPLDFHLIGYYPDYDPELLRYPNLFVSGKFRESEASALLAAAGAEIALFPAVWPETFSYTLSLAYQNGLFPISFDLGAPANRIRSCGWGEVWPFEMVNQPQAINDRLLALAVPPKPASLAIHRKEEVYPSLLKDYYVL